MKYIVKVKGSKYFTGEFEFINNTITPTICEKENARQFDDLDTAETMVYMINRSMIYGEDATVVKIRGKKDEDKVN